MKAIFAKEVEGKLVRGKPIKLAPLGGPEQMKDLSLVYIDREHPALESLTLKARYLDTLTVSGGRTHRAQAADMQLIPGPNRLGFLLNTDNLRRKRTVLSPRLIRSASVLKTNRGLTAR